MRITRNRLFAGIVAALCGCIGNAQTVIYSNSFNSGAVTINRTAPTLANSLLGGSSSARWICTTTNGVNATIYADGTIDTNPGCALLPFTPQPGCVYFMTASLTMPSGMPNWVAMGFTQAATQTNNAAGNYCRFTDNPPNGFAWLGVRANTAQGVFAGAKTGNSMGNTTIVPAGTTNLTIVLNTIAPLWTVSAYLGGTIAGTNIIGGTRMGTNFVYGANPGIAFAGLSQTSFLGQSVAGIRWNSWTLSVTQAQVPVDYWLAPTATGTGDGASSANAAGYLNASFWTSIQSRLRATNVNVNLLDGDYAAGSLNFKDMGNPDGQLILSGTNGVAGKNFSLLSSSNLASGQWTPEATNVFGANGFFSITNTVTPGARQKFYRLKLQ